MELALTYYFSNWTDENQEHMDYSIHHIII